MRRCGPTCAAIRSRAQAWKPPRGTSKPSPAACGLAQLVGARLGVAPAGSVACGVALGIPEDRRPETLTRWVYEALERGYRRVKIKVAPEWDDIAVRAARDGMAGSALPLTVDANGAYAWPEHETRAARARRRGAAVHRAAARTGRPGGARPAGAGAPHARFASTRRSRARGTRGRWSRSRVPRSGTSRCTASAVSRRCVASIASRRLTARSCGRGRCPSRGSDRRRRSPSPRCRCASIPSDLEPSARWFGRNADVIKLTMDKDGRMAVPGQAASRLIDKGRFHAAARRLGV